MKIEPSDLRDPAAVNLDKVQPKVGLGSNFEKAALPPLVFSTKSRVWGDPSPKAIEPTDPEFEEKKLRQKILHKDGFRCFFCEFRSQQNEIHNLSDNHLDIREENLGTACPLCHGWQHLGELDVNKAVIAYLPGLSAQDVNHLQRTIFLALESKDADTRDDAKKLLNWLASHRSYVKDAWGTSEPEAFANALVDLDPVHREKRQVVFEGMAVVFSPQMYSEYVSTWVAESYRTLPINKWSQVYHDVMTAPA